MKLSLFTICILFLSVTSSAQSDSVTIYLEANNSKVKYITKEISKKELPKKVIVLNCLNDTLGVHTNRNGTKSPITISLDNYDFVGFPFDMKTTCEYKFGIRNGIQKDFYDFKSVEDICIKANPFLKLKGKWKNGFKHGKWIYYNPNGTIKKVEKYKKNKICKTTYSN